MAARNGDDRRRLTCPSVGLSLPRLPQKGTDAGGHGSYTGQMMERVQSDAKRRISRPPFLQQEAVEGPVQADERRSARDSETRPTGCEGSEADKARTCAEPVTPTEIQRRRARLVTQEKDDPRNPPGGEVGPKHAHQRPLLEVSPLDGRVELDATAGIGETHAEIDVFDRRSRKPLLVETAARFEGISPHRAESGPEGCRRPRPLVMDVVVEEVAKGRDQTGASGLVVVRAEHRDELRVASEVGTNTTEGIDVNGNIRIDENEDVAARPLSTEISRPGRAKGGRLVDNDQLVRNITRPFNRADARVER